MVIPLWVYDKKYKVNSRPDLCLLTRTKLETVAFSIMKYVILLQNNILFECGQVYKVKKEDDQRLAYSGTLFGKLGTTYG